MCGIVGFIGSKSPIATIISGLKKLEYRGYDSAGIALLDHDRFLVIKQEGKISNLEKAVKKSKISSNAQHQLAIGHTRWATHGRPSERNAHPHLSQNVCVVHNGIIENYQELRESLQKKGVQFNSETDSEVIPHMIEMHLRDDKDIKIAIKKTLHEIRGSYALAIILRDHNDLLIAAKKGSPLLIGFGDGENYIASDYYALADYANKIVYLEDGEFAIVKKDKVDIFNLQGDRIIRHPRHLEPLKNIVSKGDFAHFMLKEIYEQPQIIDNILQNYVDFESQTIHLPNFPFDLTKIKKITAIACGTSYYAALAAKYFIEEIAQIEVEVDIASEFRYRKIPFREDNLMIFISQSGETADTIAALKYAKENGQKILSIVNVAESSMAQLSDVVMHIFAGPEIGVASTKAYSAQLCILGLLAIYLAEKNSRISKQEVVKNLQQFLTARDGIKKIFSDENISNIKKIAKYLTKSRHILYVGRGVSYVTALESALKLRELSYIDAQAIAAGELKHGTIALIDKAMPVIAIAPSNKLFEKIASNIEEIKARQGQVIIVSDEKGARELQNLATKTIVIPNVDGGSIVEALLSVVPMQLLAYYVALYRGNDVDQPRNLAKSVTVE